MTDAIAVLKENIKAFNDGDFFQFAATLADDVIYVEAATQRRTEGKEATVELFKAWKASFADAEGTITNIFRSGDQAVAEITWIGTHTGDMEGSGGTIPASGRKMEMTASIIVSTSDGQITESHQYFDLMTLLTQIGAMPAPTEVTAN
ncbi:MAG: ester cyclase [Chloroflexi bacterium]|nr:ester cyclase [Chloroflexota bacterium]